MYCAGGPRPMRARAAKCNKQLLKDKSVRKQTEEIGTWPSKVPNQGSPVAALRSARSHLPPSRAPTLLRAQGLAKVKITQPADSLTYMPIYVARAKNWFRDAGIEIEVVVTRGDGPDVQALMAKEVEFVATPPHHLFTLFLQNRKLLGVCGILGRCGINLVISKLPQPNAACPKACRSRRNYRR